MALVYVTDIEYQADIKVFAVGIARYVVIAVASQAQESGIPIKGIAAAGIGYEGEKFPVSQIIDPGKWCFRCSDHIFLMLIIKVTKFHNNLRFLTIKLNEGGAKNLRNTW